MVNLDLITQEEIYGLFTSQEFIQKLKKGGYHTYRTGHESKFNVVRDINKRFHVSSVAKGEFCDRIDPMFEEIKFNHGLNEFSQTYPFLYLHFHPEPEGPNYLSSEDLMGFDKDYEKFILGVGQIFKNRNIHVILVQNKRNIGQYELKDFLSEAEKFKCLTNKEVVDFFRKSGLYNSGLLSYRYVGKGGLYVPQFNQKDVASFSHSVNLDNVLL